MGLEFGIFLFVFCLVVSTASFLSFVSRIVVIGEVIHCNSRKLACTLILYTEYEDARRSGRRGQGAGREASQQEEEKEGQ